MFSIEDINEMQKTIERKDRIIKVLKERVRQWVKEYNILDEIIEMYKMSENEANEIIAELKAKIKKYAAINQQETKDYAELKAENERLKEANQSLSMLGTDLASANETVRKEFFRADKNKDMWREKTEKYRTTLQEIKNICKMDCGDCQYNQDCDCNFEECEEAKIDDILDLITKAEEE